MICSCCGNRPASIWCGNDCCGWCNERYKEEHGRSINEATKEYYPNSSGCSGGPDTPLGCLFVLAFWGFCVFWILKFSWWLLCGFGSWLLNLSQYP